MQLSRRTDHVETWSPPYVAPILARVPEIRIVPAESDAELERSLAVLNAVYPRDPKDLAGMHESQRQARQHRVLLGFLDDELAGAALVLVPSYSDVPLGIVAVHSRHRRNGLGKALLAVISEWAVDRGATELAGTVMEDDPESLTWAEKRGFSERARDLLVELDLTQIEEPAVDPPNGVEIATWADRPDAIRGIYEVATEAWPDIPGAEDQTIEPFDEWRSAHMEGIGDRPEATFVALADGEVVGYAKLSLWEAQPETAFHDLTGVKRAWRGLGIARALKTAQIAWAKRQGYARLRTANEQRNEPIRRLNAEFGYRPIPGLIRLRGPLAPRP